MIPTGRLVALAAAPAIVGLLAIGVPGLVLAVIALDIALVLIAGMDALLATGGVAATRTHGTIQAIGRDFPVEIGLLNTGRRALALRVADDPPGEAHGMPASAILRPGQHATLTYQLKVDHRGEHAFGPLTVRWESPLGLWERQTRIDTPGAVRVYPDFAQIRSYGLQARPDADRMPVRARRRPGGENEFERLRPYVPGDPYKHIDWRATARRGGEFVTREFGQEVNQNLILLLDCGRMMSAANSGMTSFDHALNAALMMGQVALRHGDRVGLLAFDDKVRAWLPPKGGARNGSRLIRATYDVFPSLAEPDYALAFRHLSQGVRRRSLVVLFTSVVDAPNATMADALVRALGTRHLPICVWVRDSGIQAMLDGPTPRPEDLYARAAASELTAWRERSLADLRRRGALVVDADPHQLTPNLLARYLEVKARRML